jgi:uncharacterized membrane protein required for colicin V production
VILLIIIGGLVIHGIIIGLVRGVFDIVGIIIGYVMALNYSSAIHLPRFLAFFLIFIIVVVAVSLSGRIISKVIHITLLGGVDRILGGVLGFLKGMIIGFIFLIIVLLVGKSNDVIHGSEIAPWVIRGGLTVSRVLPHPLYEWIEGVVTKRELVFMMYYEDRHIPL